MKTRSRHVFRNFLYHMYIRRKVYISKNLLTATNGITSLEKQNNTIDRNIKRIKVNQYDEAVSNDKPSSNISNSPISAEIYKGSLTNQYPLSKDKCSVNAYHGRILTAIKNISSLSEDFTVNLKTFEALKKAIDGCSQENAMLKQINTEMESKFRFEQDMLLDAHKSQSKRQRNDLIKELRTSEAKKYSSLLGRVGEMCCISQDVFQNFMQYKNNFSAQAYLLLRNIECETDVRDVLCGLSVIRSQVDQMTASFDGERDRYRRSLARKDEELQKLRNEFIDFKCLVMGVPNLCMKAMEEILDISYGVYNNFQLLKSQHTTFKENMVDISLNEMMESKEMLDTYDNTATSPKKNTEVIDNEPVELDINDRLDMSYSTQLESMKAGYEKRIYELEEECMLASTRVTEEHSRIIDDLKKDFGQQKLAIERNMLNKLNTCENNCRELRKQLEEEKNKHMFLKEQLLECDLIINNLRNITPVYNNLTVAKLITIADMQAKHTNEVALLKLRIKELEARIDNRIVK